MLVGAEGVVENGGIINKLGSYHVAIAAKEHRIPFYVAAESYKVKAMPPVRSGLSCKFSSHSIPPSYKKKMPGNIALKCSILF